MKPTFKVTLTVLALGFASAPLMRAEETISAVIPADPAKEAPGKKGDGKRGEGMLEARLERLDQALKLTEDQKTKIKEIWASEMKGAKDGNQESRRAAMKSAHDQVRALLTPEQQAKFDKMGMGEGGRGGGKPGAKGKKAQ